MRTLAGTLVITLSGCLVQNPAYDEPTASGSGGLSGSTGATTTAGPTTTTPTTTASASDGSGSAGESTGEGTTGAVEPTGGVSGSSGEAGSTGEPMMPPKQCLSSSVMPIAAVAIDTGVVPPAMGNPCPWGGAAGCEILNFGITEFYRLVNDEDSGKNAALIRFPWAAVVQEIVDAGRTVEDLIGARLELVTWENIPVPLEPIELDIGLIAGADSDFLIGNKLQAPATDGDSNYNCKRIEGGVCTPWMAPEGPLPSATLLGKLTVDPAMHAAQEQDGSGTEYHMLIKSEVLPAAPIVELAAKGKEPAFTVSLSSERALDEQVFGIKLEEAPWKGPSLYVVLCDQWE